jgi:hypothetical protein
VLPVRLLSAVAALADVKLLTTKKGGGGDPKFRQLEPDDWLVEANRGPSSRRLSLRDGNGFFAVIWSEGVPAWQRLTGPGARLSKAFLAN